MSRKKVVWTIAFSLFALQSILWLLQGKQALDDQVYRAIIQECTGAHRNGTPKAPRPEFFFLGPELEESLTEETQQGVREQLKNVGIKLIFEKDLTPEYTVPIRGAVSSRVFIDISWSTPLLALVEIEDGYGPDTIVAGYSTKQIHLFVFGKWLRIKRFASRSLLW